jgi:glycosyltransferase involved in cell wall biosynthesis
MWGFVLKVLRRQRYCQLIMDLYPDIAVADGLLAQGSIVQRVLHWASRFALRHSEQIIVIGRCTQERLLAEGFPQEQITVIPNWADEHVTYPIGHADNPLRQKFGLNDAFVVLYSGNMGTVHDFDDILQVAKNLAHLADLRFVFIGDGRRKAEIEAFKAGHQLDNIVLLPYQPVEELSYSLSMGNVHFVSLRQGFEGLAVPSKTYGAFAVARPVIYHGAANGEIARTIDEHQIGFVVEPGHVEQLQDAICFYYQNRDEAQTAGLRAYECSQNELSREQAMFAYQSAIESILK